MSCEKNILRRLELDKVMLEDKLRLLRGHYNCLKAQVTSLTEANAQGLKAYKHLMNIVTMHKMYKREIYDGIEDK